MSMDKFLGKWEVTSIENMEEMLVAIVDMDDEKKKMYTNMRFTMEYTRDGDKWSYTVYMPNDVKKTFTFVEDEEFESSTLDGRPILSKISIKNGKFVEHHRDRDDASLDAEMVREIIDDHLIVTATVRNVTSKTTHARVK